MKISSIDRDIRLIKAAADIIVNEHIQSRRSGLYIYDLAGVAKPDIYSDVGRRQINRDSLLSIPAVFVAAKRILVG